MSIKIYSTSDGFNLSLDSNNKVDEFFRGLIDSVGLRNISEEKVSLYRGHASRLLQIGYSEELPIGAAYLMGFAFGDGSKFF